MGAVQHGQAGSEAGEGADVGGGAMAIGFAFGVLRFEF